MSSGEPAVKVNNFKNSLTKNSPRVLSFREALVEAQEQILQSDERVVLMGEGVNDIEGILGTTTGLYEKFGKDKIIDIPIAENGLTGVAVGMAIAGMRPIFVHMRMDFLLMCMDQLINHAAKWHYITGGHVNIPLVIRTIIGQGWGSAAQHSQALHSIFAHIPGFKVVMPTTAYDVKGLFIAAVRDGNPVLFCEHKRFYDCAGEVPQKLYEVPIGKGIIRRAGGDVTVVAISQMAHEAIEAAKILESRGIEIEIIDPRSVRPLDEELILNSVNKTKRLVIADAAHGFCGVSAEIAARILEKGRAILKAPLERVCFPDAPVPASSVLEKAYYPDKDRITEAVEKVMGIG